MTRLLHPRPIAGLYSCEAYFCAFISSSLLISSLNTLALVIPLYLLVGFAASFTKVSPPRLSHRGLCHAASNDPGSRPSSPQLLVFLGALCIMTGIGMTVGLTIGCFARDFDEARNYLMPALAPQVTNGNHTQSQPPARANHMPGT